MDRTRRDTLLGLVFFAALAFLLWATVNLTDVNLPQELEVWFDDGGGAQVGTNVLVLGKKMGKVSAIEVDYARERPVQMLLLLEDSIPLTTEARIEVRADGVLGGKLIYIDPGRGALIDIRAPLTGTTERSLFERIADIADGKGILGENVNGMVSAIRLVAESLQDERNSLGRLLTRRELYDEVLQTIQRMNGILEAIQGGQSTIGRLAVDTAMGEQVQVLIDNLAAASAALRSSDGTVGLLLNDRETAQNVRTVVADLREIVADAKAGRGVVGRALRDDALADDLASALASLDDLLAKANDPDAGLIGAAFSDPVSGENFKIAVANIRDVTEALTRSDGALGILINDRDFGARLRRIFTMVARALEDAREAAPISSFVQVLLGVF